MLRPTPRFPGLAGSRTATLAAVGILALLAAAARLPFLHSPLSPDESGFLLLSEQWRHGTSLYGDYWVDRPPLLIAMFGLAAHLGRLADPGVRVLGMLAAGISVLLSGLVTRLISPAAGLPRVYAVVAAAAFLASPLFGVPETNGELLALPFVLAGIACLVGSLRDRTGRRAVLLAAAAGAAGMAAALVKQNVVDVFVFAAVALVVARRHTHARGLLARAAAVAGGAGAVLVAVLVGAAARGTSPAALWSAVVLFRFRASAVIGSSSGPTTWSRFWELLQSFLVSGAAPLLVVTVVLVTTAALSRRGLVNRHHQQVQLTWPILATVAWELCGVLLGGSYWLHYLTGLVPGLVLLLGWTRAGRRAWVAVAGVAYVLVACVTSWIQQVEDTGGVSTDEQVAGYLRTHADPSDGVVVAFGHPDIVADSGLASPYPELWSLPVRVRDPHLRGLDRVMSGPHSPRWLVVDGHSVASWGLDAATAQHYLVRHYVERVTYGDWHVWQHRGEAPS